MKRASCLLACTLLTQACGQLPGPASQDETPATQTATTTTQPAGVGPSASTPTEGQTQAPQTIDVDATVQQLTASTELAATQAAPAACKPSLDPNTPDLKALLPVIEAILKNATPANIIKFIKDLTPQQLKTLFTLLGGVLKEVVGCAAQTQSKAQAASLALVPIPVPALDACQVFIVDGASVQTCVAAP